MLIRLILILLLTIDLVYCSNKIKTYAKSLERLTTEQYITLVQAYKKGCKNGMGLLLTAIVWKESSFGRRMVNSKDGKNGSFGVAQILLDTAMKRNNVTTIKDKEKLKFKLLTNPDFNLDQALAELIFWRDYHKKRNKKQWRLFTVASYNTGRKSYNSVLGKRYADDVAVRIEALKMFLDREEFNFDLTMNDELNKVSAKVFGKTIR